MELVPSEERTKHLSYRTAKRLVGNWSAKRLLNIECAPPTAEQLANSRKSIVEKYTEVTSLLEVVCFQLGWRKELVDGVLTAASTGDLGPFLTLVLPQRTGTTIARVCTSIFQVVQGVWK